MLHVIIVLLFLIFVPVTASKLISYKFYVPEDFSCGTDEICYCNEAKDCVRKNESKKEI